MRAEEVMEGKYKRNKEIYSIDKKNHTHFKISNMLADTDNNNSMRGLSNKVSQS